MNITAWYILGRTELKVPSLLTVIAYYFYSPIT